MEHNFQSKNEKKLYNIVRMIKGYELQKQHATDDLSKNKRDESAKFRLKDAEKELKEWHDRYDKLWSETSKLMSKQELKELGARLKEYYKE